MIPVPQYPVFSSTLAELGVASAPYFLDEGAGWALPERALRRAWRAASAAHAVRALVVINPGNPTGQVRHAAARPHFAYELTNIHHYNIKIAIILIIFAARHPLLDKVRQTNRSRAIRVGHRF